MEHKLPIDANGVNVTLDELLFYKQQSVKWLPPAKSLWSQLLGQHQSRQLGRGMDFAEVRQYQAGDDIRSIDWRVTARTGKTHTKLFSEEKEKPVVLYLDLSHSMIFGSTLMLKSVVMMHMASLIAWLTVAQKDRIGAVIDTGTQLVEIKPSAQNRGPLAILQQLITLNEQQLATNQQDSGQNLSTAFQAIHRLAPKGAEIILMSDFIRLTKEDERGLSRLAQHNRVRMIHILDPLELGQTHFRGVEQVSDRKKTLWLDFSSPKTRQQLELAFTHKQQGLKTLAHKTGISFSALTSAQPLLQQLSG
ncbi:DUF58 domain-containing protein [Vibrio scophthalmi]|uniref:DUF58 domain-containing protein n=1 Tax=Vibrio scophthalmi TaxID=45658 RepID=A0A1E3WIZ2_9VIBR|nr:DUF58 domain-containing protein [Vibrio scophthalmi]ODS04987.1 uncharacterized protein VSF3289_04127 [Vibrio scophthalmi]